jgi:hypothetical protein
MRSGSIQMPQLTSRLGKRASLSSMPIRAARRSRLSPGRLRIRRPRRGLRFRTRSIPATPIKGADQQCRAKHCRKPGRCRGNGNGSGRSRKEGQPASLCESLCSGANGLWDEGFGQLTRAPDVQDAIRAATRTGANRATVDGFAAPKNPFVENNGALSLKKNPDGTTAYPSLQFWDHVQRNLRDKAKALARAGNDSAASDTAALHKALVNHLDQLAPAFREARQGAALGSLALRTR